MRLTSLLHLSSSRLPSGSRVAGGLRPCPDGMRREGWRSSLSLLSRSLRLEVRFSLFTSHLSSDSEPRSGEQRRWVDRRRTDPRKLRQVVRILGLEVRLNGHEI